MKKINIDTVKLIASFMIVAIHVYPLESINSNLDYIFTRILFRIAVPTFLMITGYFVLPKTSSNVNYLKNYTKKILKLYIISIGLYIPLNIYMGYFNNNNLLIFVKDVFLNGTFYHLWYFPALLLGIWIDYFLIKIKNHKIIFFIVLILFFIGLFGDSYYNFISDISFFKKIYMHIFTIFDYTRNGLFYAPIFIYIGYLFNFSYQKKSYFSRIILLIISIILLLIEGIILYFYNIPRHNSMYIFLIPTSIFLFSIILKNKTTRNIIYKNLSTWIYILHPLFIVGIRFLGKILNISIIVNNSIINYLLVLSSTIVFIIISKKVGKKLLNI